MSNGIGKGVCIALGCAFSACLVAFASFAASNAAGLVVILGIGIVQAAWIVPLWLHYRRAGEAETAKGLIIAAGIIFLLNASCWGVVATMR